MKAQHEGALTPPCIIRKNPQVPHSAQQVATPSSVLAWRIPGTGVEKTLESPLDCKEIQPVHSKGDQSWVFFGRNDAMPTQETQAGFLGQEDPLEEETAIHSSILTWEISWTEEPGRPQPMGCLLDNPVSEGTTRRGTDTPVHHPEKPAGSSHSSTSGLSPREQLEKQAEFHSSTQDDA